MGMGQIGAGKYRRTNPETRQRICDLYQAGRTIPEIAALTGFSAGTVTNVARAAGITGAGRTTGIRTDPETEARIMALYEQGATWARIMQESGRTEHTVSAVIKRNGGTLDRGGRLTDEQRTQIRSLYAGGKGAPEIGLIIGCHSSAVYYVLNEAGIDRRERIACENPGYFDQIDSPDKAYWLGFIGADGCVTGLDHGNPRLQVKLARKDRDHLVLLHETLKATRPIRDHEEFSAGQMRPYSTLAVYSRQLADSLIAAGITPRKSATLQPWDGPATLMPHYWRGLVDGDGHIHINDRGVFTGLLGSEAVAKAYAAWVNALIGTRVNATQKGQSRGAWSVQVGGTVRVLRLLAALYDDAPVTLSRKKALADLAVHGKPLAAPLF